MEERRETAILARNTCNTCVGTGVTENINPNNAVTPATPVTPNIASRGGEKEMPTDLAFFIYLVN
jgi:hypothetical protein